MPTDEVTEEVAEPEPSTSSGAETAYIDPDFRNVWDSLRSVYGDRMCGMDEYVACDDVAETTRQLTDEEIVEMVENPTAEEDDDEGESEGATVTT